MTTIDPRTNERTYLNLLHTVLSSGERRTNRTGTDTIGIFGPQLRFTLGPTIFPLMTTKRVHFKSIAHELLWMLSGSSRIDYLRENGVTIWDEWAKDGDLGPVYGVQWRHYQALIRDAGVMASPREFIKPEGRYWHLTSGVVLEVDQIAEIVRKLRDDRFDRRIMLTAWNPGELHLMGLPPCHYSAQFYVDNEFGLHTICNVRSWDLFLGGPFNIAQYALLTHMLAQICRLRPVELIINAGDAHIYVNHLDQVREQLSREPMMPPKLVLDSNILEIDDFRYEHIGLVDYVSHPSIKGDVAV